MNRSEFEMMFNNMELDSAYADFIMEHCAGDRVICNGDTLVEAMEDMYLFEDFADTMVTE
jgi:hypothetical protein